MNGRPDDRSERRALWQYLKVLLLLVVLQAPLHVHAQTSTSFIVGDWTYAIDNGTAMVTKYSGSDTEVTIPATVVHPSTSIEYPVRSLQYSLFQNNTTLTSVTVPEGVTIIGQSCFEGCTNLVSVSLPSTVDSLGIRSFKDCASLQSIVLPDNLRYIHRITFKECTHLSSVTLPANLVSIEEEAFYGCSALSSITLPANLAFIEQGAFIDCSLTSITLPASIQEIGKSAFSTNRLTSITLPASIQEIGDFAFENNILMENVWFEGSHAQWNNVVRGESAFPGGLRDWQYHWRCTVTFDMLGHGTAPDAQVVYSNVENAITQPDDPSAEGYTFRGWFKESACINFYNFATAITDNDTVYAKWTANYNTITFNLGGKGESIADQIVTSGNTVTEPDIQFVGESGSEEVIEGWYTDEGCTAAYDFSTPVTQSMTLYAKWVAARQVTIKTDGSGTCTLTGPRYSRTTSGPVPPGEYTLTITPGSGCSFSGDYTLTGNTATAVSGNTERTYSNIDLSSLDLLVDVTFTSAPTVSVIVTTDDSGITAGSYTITDSRFSSPVSYTSGDALQLVNDPNSGMANAAADLKLTITKGNAGCEATIERSNLPAFGETSPTSYNDSQTGSTIKIRPYGNVTITLFFYSKTAERAVSLASGDSHGTVTGTGNYTYGSTVNLTVTPHAGYQLGTLTYTPEGGDPQVLNVTDNSASFTMPAKAVTLTATWTPTFTGGLSLTTENETTTATFDGTSGTSLSIQESIEVDAIVLNRSFYKSKAATLMLPFSIDVSNVSGATFYTFGGVSYNSTSGKWEATMNEATGTLAANTPYMVMPTATALTFTGGATLNTTGGGGMQTTGVTDWTFNGTYANRTWTELGTDYGFAATSGSAADGTTYIEAGQFVRFTTGAWLNPMRCYLSYTGASAPAPSRDKGAAAAAASLPATITVRLVGADGQVTGIGTLDTETGELSMDGWYDLSGRKLNAQPTVKGIYIHNGKKVTIQ